MSDNLSYEYRTGLKRIELENELPEIVPSAEKIILQFGGREGKSFDIGALCYSKRESYTGFAWAKTGKKVILDTLDADRVQFLNCFIRYLFGKKGAFTSKFTRCEYLALFIHHFEAVNEGSHFFKVENSSNNIDRFYHSIRQFYFENKTVTHIWDFFCYLFGVEGAESQLNLQYWYGHENEESSVKPLFDDEIKNLVDFYQMLFIAGEDLLVKNENFPYRWCVPEFLNETDNRYTLLSTVTSIFHRRQAEGRSTISTFDFDSDTWLFESKIDEKHFQLKKRSLDTLLKRIDKDRALQEEANKNSLHRARIYFAELAMMAYRNIFMVLLASNGSGLENYQDLNDIPWGDFKRESYAKSYWKFSYKKGRAYHKKVEFKLLKTDYPLFFRYLSLRKKLIHAYGKSEEDCYFLFFKFSKKGFKPFSYSKKFVEHFPEVPKITPQIARATKSDILLHLSNDLRLVADILQNTPQTVLEKYAKGTVRGHVSEVGNFLSNISIVVKQTVRKPSDIESEVGECEEFNPRAVDLAPSHIKPDCASKEGCLFCDKYRVHADKKDVRKLLSYLYFIQDAEMTLSETDQFEAYFTPVIERIEQILRYIKELSHEHESMVIRLESEVLEDGELSEFFERELLLREEVNDLWLN